MSEDLNKFSSSPEEIHAYLRERLCENTYWEYQVWIGQAAVQEVIDEILFGIKSSHNYADFLELINRVNPSKGGGWYPSSLVDPK